MSMNFVPGDRVRVRKGLTSEKRYDNLYCSPAMAAMGGHVLTVRKIKDGCERYQVMEHDWVWNDAMLDHYPVYRAGDKVRIRRDLEDDSYGGVSVVGSMRHMAGREMTIKCVVTTSSGDTDRYYLLGSPWVWHADMFEHGAKAAKNILRPGDFVKLPEMEDWDYGITDASTLSGKIFKVCGVHDDRYVYVDCDSIEYSFPSESLTKVTFSEIVKADVEKIKKHAADCTKPMKIELDYDGRKTICTVYQGSSGLPVSFGVARRSPDDAPDAGVGAFWALCRAGIIPHTDAQHKEKAEPEKPLWNGKVVCLNPGASKNLTQYKLYTVKDGLVTDDAGSKMPQGGKRIHSLEEFKASTPGTKWLEVIDEEDVKGKKPEKGQKGKRFLGECEF